MASSLDTSIFSSSSPLSSASLLLKLRYLKRAKLFSLSDLSHLSFSKLLSLVAQAFPETRNGSSAPARHRHESPSSPHIHTATHIELTYHDEDGDSVVIDSDESLNLAALSFQRAHVDVIKLQIHIVKDDQSLTNDHNIDWKSLAPMSTYFASSSYRGPHIPCRHFQASSCRFGLSRRFLHHDACNKIRRKSGLCLNEFEIDEWLMTQRSASENENISYLSSQEGYDSLVQILNHPHLPLIVIYQLASLLTRPNFRISLLKEATDKIYNAFLGSQLLIALHSHIRTSVKPILGCVEPYVFLCEEIVGRTSNGWKEVPLDELKTLVDGVKNGSARELSDIIARLLDHRAKKKILMEAVE